MPVSSCGQLTHGVIVDLEVVVLVDDAGQLVAGAVGGAQDEASVDDGAPAVKLDGRDDLDVGHPGAVVADGGATFRGKSRKLLTI